MAELNNVVKITIYDTYSENPEECVCKRWKDGFHSKSAKLHHSQCRVALGQKEAVGLSLQEASSSLHWPG